MNSRYLWCVALVSALGGFLFGYDWVVIGGAKPFYEAYFGIVQPSREAWAMSCALVGCLIGAVSSGFLSERIGRRKSLLISALIFAVSSAGTGSAMSFTAFVLWRIAGGIAIGMASGLSPVYIAEIAPAASRGKLVCLNELTIVLGIVAAQTVNWLIARPVAIGASLMDIQSSWNGQQAWRLMFEAAVVPATVFLAGVYFIPESPRWLARHGYWERARHVLIRFGGEGYAIRVVDEMRASFHTEVSSSVGVALRNPRLLPVLGIGITLAVLQQWCGINVIFNYAQEIFSAAGYTLSNIFFNIVVTGVVMCVFTFVAIATVERLGRRRLMLLGCAGLAFLYGILGWLYFTKQHGLPLLLLVVAAIACYAMTLAPITWVVLSEIFPNDVRGVCMSICTAALWAACFMLTYTFPLLNSALGTARTFWIYAMVCTVGFFFVFRYLPETKQKTLEEIQQSWHV
jgi:sugar porter (SP) family MFS transporter